VHGLGLSGHLDGDKSQQEHQHATNDGQNNGLHRNDLFQSVGFLVIGGGGSVLRHGEFP